MILLYLKYREYKDVEGKLTLHVWPPGPASSFEGDIWMEDEFGNGVDKTYGLNNSRLREQWVQDSKKDKLYIMARGHCAGEWSEVGSSS